MKQLGIILVFVLAFASCTKKSNKIDTSELYQVHRFEYHEYNNRTEIKLRLRKKKDIGANIEFVGDDYVKIMDGIASYEGAGEYTYTAELFNLIDSAYTTVYHKGTTLNNYGLFSNVYTCSLLSSQEDVYTGFTWYFYWNGPPIQGSNDEIKIEVLTSSGDVVMTKTNDSNDYNEIVIYSSQFSNLSGFYKLRVTRTRELPLINSTASGGQIEMVYVDEGYVNFI